MARTAQGTCGVKGRIHFNNHAISDNALLDQLLRFLGGHLGNALSFTVEDTADIRQQDQIRPQGGRQRCRRLVSIDVHQLAFIGHPDRAHHWQVTARQQGVDQRRGTRLRQPDMAKLGIQLCDLHAIAIAEEQADRGQTMLFRPRQQRLVGGSRQRAGNDVNLIGRRHTQTIFLLHRQIKLLHQLIHHAATAMDDDQRALVRFTVVNQRGKQALQRFFAIE